MHAINICFHLYALHMAAFKLSLHAVCLLGNPSFFSFLSEKGLMMQIWVVGISESCCSSASHFDVIFKKSVLVISGIHSRFRRCYSQRTINLILSFLIIVHLLLSSFFKYITVSHYFWHCHHHHHHHCHYYYISLLFLSVHSNNSTNQVLIDASPI